MASHKLYLSLAMSAEGVSWEPVLLLVTQEPQLGTPKAGLSLGTILLSLLLLMPRGMHLGQTSVARSPAVAVRGTDQRRMEVTTAPASEQELGAAFH